MAIESEVKFHPTPEKLPQEMVHELPTTTLKLTAPIPMGWTEEMVVTHIQDVLSVCAGGSSYRDVRNVFNKETITVTSCA